MLSGFLSNGHLPRVSRQSRLSTNEKGDNKMKPGAVLRSPGIYFKIEENPGKPPAYIRKKDDCTIVADTTSILSRWELFYINLLFVNHSVSHEGSEVYTAEPDIPDPSLIEVELAIGKLKRHKATGVDHIPCELIQTSGGKLYEEILKLIVLIWNKEELPQEWKESIIVPIHKKGDRMD